MIKRNVHLGSALWYSKYQSLLRVAMTAYFFSNTILLGDEFIHIVQWLPARKLSRYNSINA